jgi:cytochrome b-561 domain containing protein 2
MSQAILTLSDNIYFTYKPLLKYRLLVHWMLSAIAGILITIAVVCMYCNKLKDAKPHFQSVHSVFGLITICLTLITIGLGVFTQYKLPFGLISIRPVTKKLAHTLLGMSTYILAVITIEIGIYNQIDDTVFVNGTLIVIILMTSIHVLLKPLTLVVCRLYMHWHCWFPEILC